jgi:threonine/homoserine/homoserine lactone efflux protein
MSYLGLLLTIAGVLTLSLLSPEPNFVIVTSTAMMHSRRAGVLIGLGLAAASFTWSLLAVAGLALIISQGSWLYLLIKLAGAVYLMVLGVQMVLGARKPLAASNVNDPGGLAAVRKGFVVSMMNPKSIAFYGSIFAIMVPRLGLHGDRAHIRSPLGILVLRSRSAVLERRCAPAVCARESVDGNCDGPDLDRPRWSLALHPLTELPSALNSKPAAPIRESSAGAGPTRPVRNFQLLLRRSRPR